MAEGGAEEESSGDMLGPAALAGIVPSTQHHHQQQQHHQHPQLHQSSPPPARLLQPGGTHIHGAGIGSITNNNNNGSNSSTVKGEDSDRDSSVESPEPASATMGIDGTTDITHTKLSQTMFSEENDKIANNNNSTHLNGAIAGLVTLQNLQNLASLQQSLPQVASLAANLQNMTTTLAASAAAAASASAAAAAGSSLNAPLNLSITPASNMRTPHPTSNTETASALNNLANTAAGLHNTAAMPPNMLPGAQQPVSMPQFILASGQLVQGIQGAQLLIPTAQGLATQTILTIPVSHVNSSDQMVNLALNNGQVITTSLANLQAMAQPNLLSASNPTIPTTNGALPHPPLNLNPTTISQLLQNGAAAAATTQQLMQSLPQILNHVNANQPQVQPQVQPNPQQLPPTTQQQQSSASLLNSLAQQLTHPAVVSTPPSLLTSTAVNTTACAAANVAAAQREVQRQQQERERERERQHQQQERERQERQERLSGGYGSYASVDKMHQQSGVTSQQSGGSSNGPTSMLGKGGSVGTVASILPVSSNGSSASSTISRLNGELTITTTSMPPSSHQHQQNISSQMKGSPSLSPCGDNSSTADLLIDSPNQPTINQANTNVVDGINLDEIKDFAKAFKLRRLSLGLTQTQVGQALSVTEGPAYSQSAICSALASQMFAAAQLSSQQQAMFEKLDITPKSAQKIKPVLERWMKEAEDSLLNSRYKSGQNHLTDFIGMEPSKKRKRRTSFTPQALELLNAHFERNTHPSGTEITGLAHQLGYEREVIRIWFCNKRQALKNTVRMMSKGMV